MPVCNVADKDTDNKETPSPSDSTGEKQVISYCVHFYIKVSVNNRVGIQVKSHLSSICSD